MRFEFATATRIVFGAGTLTEAGPLAAEMGRRAFVVHDGARERSEPLIEILSRAGMEWTEFTVTGEPTIPGVLSATEAARGGTCDVVVGIGGGSVIDTGKTVAALLTNGGEPLDYLEVIGKGRKIGRPAAPYIAIPTTAGTGAEVTRNSVLLAPEHKVKVSMRSPLMLPRVALVDPMLTHSMPPAVTASTGLDALTQVLEPFVSKKANPLTDGICREGLALASRSLRRAYEDGSDAEAREDMALASLFGGLALANAGLGAAHGFAGPLGGMFPAPHGAVCARLLPYAVETNVRALQERQPDSPVLERFTEIARILTGDPGADIQDGIKWIQDLCADLKVPPLSEYGVEEKDFPAVIKKAQKASSMKGNPVELPEVELTDILRRAAG